MLSIVDVESWQLDNGTDAAVRSKINLTQGTGNRIYSHLLFTQCTFLSPLYDLARVYLQNLASMSTIQWTAGGMYPFQKSPLLAIGLRVIRGAALQAKGLPQDQTEPRSEPKNRWDTSAQAHR